MSCTNPKTELKIQLIQSFWTIIFTKIVLKSIKAIIIKIPEKHVIINYSGFKLEFLE